MPGFTTRLLVSAFALSALAFPAETTVLQSRQAVDNLVYVTDSNKFWCALFSSVSPGIPTNENPSIIVPRSVLLLHWILC